MFFTTLSSQNLALNIFFIFFMLHLTFHTNLLDTSTAFLQKRFYLEQSSWRQVPLPSVLSTEWDTKIHPSPQINTINFKSIASKQFISSDYCMSQSHKLILVCKEHVRDSCTSALSLNLSECLFWEQHSCGTIFINYTIKKKKKIRFLKPVVDNEVCYLVI